MMQTTCSGLAKNDGMNISDDRVGYKLWHVFRKILSSTIWKDHTVQYNVESSTPYKYPINAAYQVL
jgi:hypothetical protein